MAFNPYNGLSASVLLAARTKIQTQLLEAKTGISVGSGDVTAAFQSKRLAELLSTLEQIEYALYLLDPDTYPLTNTATSRTRAVFS